MSIIGNWDDPWKRPKEPKPKKVKPRKKRKLPKEWLRTYVNRALLPNGTVAQKITARKYTHALCAPQISGRDDLWVVLRWSKDEAKLKAEGRLRDSQTNGERKTVVVPVVVAKR